jgi:hypothetical protein
MRPEPFSKAFRSQSPQEQGRRKEKELARDMGGQQQPASGAFPGHKGDVVKDQCLIEHKYTKALSFPLTLSLFRKIRREAEESGKKPVVVLEFSGGFSHSEEKWAMVPYEEWKALLEKEADHERYRRTDGRG